MSKSNITVLQSRIQEAKSLLSRAKKFQLTSEDHSVLSKWISEHPTIQPESDLHTAHLLLDNLKSKLLQEQDDLLQTGLMFGLTGDKSSAPNDVLRGSLFAPIRRGRRKALASHMVSSNGKVSMFYSGVQLDQADLDVMLGLTRVLNDATATGNVEHITSEGRIEWSRVRFTQYSFLKSIHRKTGKLNYKTLQESLQRLTGELRLADEHGSIAGGILGKRFIREEDGMMVVDINHDYIKLFQNDQFALIEMDIRHKLKGDFARWLYGFVLTHTGTSYRKAETLMELSGMSMARIRDFISKQATPAFQQLVDLSVIEGFTKKGQNYEWTRK